PRRFGYEVWVPQRRGECLAHDRHALDRNVGRQGVGSAELGARKNKPHELALFDGLRVIEDGRHLGDFRDRRLLCAQEKDKLAVADKLLVDAKLTVRGASPLHLAALHGNSPGHMDTGGHARTETLALCWRHRHIYAVVRGCPGHSRTRLDSRSGNPGVTPEEF